MFGNPTEVVNGLTVDWRWEDKKTKYETGALVIRRAMFVIAPKFYFFMVMDIALSLVGTSFLSIASLVLLAFGMSHAAIIVLAIVAGCSFVNYWLHPHSQQLAYEAAVQKLWSARNVYIAGDTVAASRLLQEAIDLTTPKVL
jgi:hypothetical protein